MKRKFEGKVFPFPCTGKSNMSSHAFHEFVADGQSEARSPEPSGDGFIGLMVGLEEVFYLFFRHPDSGVAYFKAKGKILLILFSGLPLSKSAELPPPHR
ncbi:MAG: hypothetical protein MZV49_13465 [Rhodopseudomonas palustris]|nr:hypothetical protein [Rhodopseudomonas palustris]